MVTQQLFRLLRGHVVLGVKNPDGTPKIDPATGTQVSRRIEQSRDPDKPTEFWSDLNLLNLNGPKPQAPKFELVRQVAEPLPTSAHVWDEAKETFEQFAERMKQGREPTAVQAPATSTIDSQAGTKPPSSIKTERPLEQLSLEELRKLAEANEVDFKKCNGSKDKMIAEIRKQLGE